MEKKSKNKYSNCGFASHPYSWEGIKRGKFTEEHIKKLRISHIGINLSEKAKKLAKLRFLNNNPMKDYKTRERVRNTLKKHWEDKEFRDKRVKSFQRSAYKVSQTMKELCQNPNIIEARRITAKKLWKNKEYAQKVMAKSTPNKKELILLNLLNESFPNEWEYVGDWKVIIDGKCPDFININGKKAIIELFGNYWHSGNRGDNEITRINHFSRYGYQTLIIWENELKHPLGLIEKINNFIIQSCKELH